MMSVGLPTPTHTPRPVNNLHNKSQTMSVPARVLILVFSATAIGFIIATSVAKDSVTKACNVPLSPPPIVVHRLLPALAGIPLPETGLFRGKQTYVFPFGRSYSDGILTTSRDINTKDLTPVSSLFEAAQAFAISTAIVFFVASCVHIAQFMGVELQAIGRGAGFIHLVGTVLAVISGSILLGAVHRDIMADESFWMFRSGDYYYYLSEHSLSECPLNYGIPFIFAAAGLGIVNCILFYLTQGAAAAPSPEDSTADVEGEAAPANVEAKEVHTTEPSHV